MFFALSAPSHYLTYYYNIVNWTLRNTFQWNLNRNSYIYIQEDFVLKMAAILSRPQYTKSNNVAGNADWIQPMGTFPFLLC